MRIANARPVLPAVALEILLALSPRGPGSACLAAEAVPAPAPASITLVERHGHATANRQGYTHTGGGNIDVAQPAPDTIIVTMTGVVMAGGHPCKDSVATLDFDLNQVFELSFADPKLRRAKVSMEARVIGLLRSRAACCMSRKGCGTAEISAAHAAITADCGQLLSLALVPHAVACGENLSVNDHEGPREAQIVPGKYTLHETFVLTAAHPRNLLPCQTASAEFAPDPALDPLWLSAREPFHGAVKRDFGFQLLLHVSPAEPDGGK